MLIGMICVGIVINSTFSSTKSSSKGSHTSSQAGDSAPGVHNVSTPKPVIQGSQWSYHLSDDPMGKGTVFQAQVASSNTVEFDFPYAGKQHATLTLRTHPRYGKDIIFSIEKGQFLCRSYEDCIVLVRFDDEQPINYTAAGAEDNSTETVFIRNYGRFVEKMLKAKQVRIAANVYQQGSPMFEFDVSGFTQNKYKPNNKVTRESPLIKSN